MTGSLPQPPGHDHVVSIDVEDYRQILTHRYQGRHGPVNPGFQKDMDAVLGLLEETNTKATLFVLGLVASQCPEMLRHWAALGHEVACHGWSHLPAWSMDASAFRQELRDARAAIADAIGCPPRGYRAAIFSIRWDTLWALEVVAEEGFAYDSSIVPVRMKRYGVEGFSQAPINISLPGGRRIVEVPITTAGIFGRTTPVAGGGYFRLLPRRLIARSVRQCRAEGRPFVMYVHPDELGGQRFKATDLARTLPDRVAAGMLELRSNLGRRRVRGIVRRLLKDYRFGPIGPLADETARNGTTAVLGAAR